MATGAVRERCVMFDQGVRRAEPRRAIRSRAQDRPKFATGDFGSTFRLRRDDFTHRRAATLFRLRSAIAGYMNAISRKLPRANVAASNHT
jgi:hypothetical protein